jgi:YfiR/HmsC-like
MKKSAIPGKPLSPKKVGAKFVFIVSILLAAAPVVPAQGTDFGEYGIEAAFLSNFGKFVDWPQSAFQSPNAPIVIGVYGADPFRDSLVHIVQGKTIDGHLVVVQPLSFNTLQNCHVLFISPSERKNLTAIVRKLDDSTVLTVSENIDLSQSGVMINLVRKNNQIHFEINDAAAKRAGLKISSKLLSLATKIAMTGATPKQQVLLCDRSP